MNETIKSFGYPDTVIREYIHWVVMLRPQQVTIGSLIIAAKSNTTRLGDLGSEAWSEFAQVSKEMEQLLSKVFSAEKFNYLALMMKDPNPHFHLVPRYSKSIILNGKEHSDADWPLKTELKKIDLTDEDLACIKKALT